MEQISITHRLYELFQGGPESTKAKATRALLEIIPKEPRTEEIRQSLVFLIENIRDKSEIAEGREQTRVQLFGTLSGPGEMTIPFRLLLLTIDLWIAESESLRCQCAEWTEEFLRKEDVDYTPLLELLHTDG